eukprot:6490596-Amphidinium_carterae.2
MRNGGRNFRRHFSRTLPRSAERAFCRSRFVVFVEHIRPKSRPRFSFLTDRIPIRRFCRTHLAPGSGAAPFHSSPVSTSRVVETESSPAEASGEWCECMEKRHEGIHAALGK